MVKFQPSKLAMRVRFPLPAHLPMKIALKGEAPRVSQNGKSDIVHGTCVPGQSRIASARVGVAAIF
jgi:hypothetical protein